MSTEPTTPQTGDPAVACTALLAFRAERNEALLSLDAAKIRGMVRRRTAQRCPQTL